jgi:DNA repair protein RecO (recombination protein O)
MTARQAALAHGYVLHTRPWRNTSLLVEALTPEAGRIGLVARGVRSRGNRSRALLEPFQPLLLAWSGRGELRTLTTVEAGGRRGPPTGRALLAAFYASELILRLLGRDEPEPAVFAGYHEAVDALARGQAAEPVLRRFELILLDALGFAPPLDSDADSGAPIDAGRDYDFRVEQGATPARGLAPADALRLPGAHLHAIAAFDFSDPDVLRSARRLLRASLAPHLGSRPLRSRELYRSMYGRR